MDISFRLESKACLAIDHVGRASIGKVESFETQVLQRFQSRDTWSDDAHDDVDESTEKSDPNGQDYEDDQPDQGPDDSLNRTGCHDHSDDVFSLELLHELLYNAKSSLVN